MLLDVSRAKKCPKDGLAIDNLSKVCYNESITWSLLGVIMAKRLFLLLFSAFIGIVGNPEILMASDSYELVGISNAGITETIPIEEPVSEVVEESAAPTPIVTTSYVAPAPAYVAPQIANYTVSFYINSVDEYTNTVNSLRYDGIYKFRKMIYGHNTGNLLGNLTSRYIGENLTITEGGVTKQYVVSDIQVYRKTEDGYLENNRKLMSNIANTAMGHDIALFTCYGTSYGNGDASHRLVVFANAV